jgi:hypothetical protein
MELFSIEIFEWEDSDRIYFLSNDNKTKYDFNIAVAKSLKRLLDDGVEKIKFVNTHNRHFMTIDNSKDLITHTFYKLMADFGFEYINISNMIRFQPGEFIKKENDQYIFKTYDDYCNIYNDKNFINEFDIIEEE